MSKTILVFGAGKSSTVLIDFLIKEGIVNNWKIIVADARIQQVVLKTRNSPIAEAAKIVTTADILVVVGTSLQVYPAAGLIDYVLPGVPIFIIDKKIPPVSYLPELVTIEKPATEGINELITLLEKYR